MKIIFTKVQKPEKKHGKNFEVENSPAHRLMYLIINGGIDIINVPYDIRVSSNRFYIAERRRIRSEHNQKLYDRLLEIMKADIAQAKQELHNAENEITMKNCQIKRLERLFNNTEIDIDNEKAKITNLLEKRQEVNRRII